MFLIKRPVQNLNDTISAATAEVGGISMDSIMDTGYSLLLDYGPKVIMAVLVLVIGSWVVKRMTKMFKKMLVKRGVEASLHPFLGGIVGGVLKVMLLLSVLGMVGVEVTSFVAILGAAGLAIGLALSGTLQNFAGGVMLLIFKPFKAGDFIETSGFAGVVQEIQIFNTIMTTGDNRTVIIPNAGLSNSAMVNFSTQPQRRVDMAFGIGYGDDIDKAKTVLQGILDTDERILKDPESLIVVSELGADAVVITVRAWVDSANYWGVYFATQETVKKTFDQEGLSFPYPQRDVHMQNA
jgi:small conductance mechanosensitive channel